MNSSEKKSTRDNKYIKDYGEAPKGAPRFSAIAGTLIVSSLMGFILGALIRFLLFAVTFLTKLLWDVLPGAMGIEDLAWLPLPVCIAGGLIIGIWHKKFHIKTESLTEVIAKMKKDGEYRVSNLPAAIPAFLFPLIFGGSVGPEAGLTGFISIACSKISTTLRKIGLKVRSINESAVSAVICAVFGAPLAGIVLANDTIPDEKFFTYRRSVKIILYAIAAGGAFAGIWAASLLTGEMAGIPRFESFSFRSADIKVGLICIAGGYILSWLFHLSRKFAGFISGALKDHVILQALICGIVLGVAGTFLPLTLFSGEEQSREIMTTWPSYAAPVLVLTAFVKAFLTPLCLKLGWDGGNIFPCIFAGAALGFGIASFTGADSAFCVAVSTAVFMGGMNRKPIFAIGLLLLCFPIRGFFFVILAALIGAALPIAKAVSEMPYASLLSKGNIRKKR